MMNATAFAGPDVRARPIKAAALGVMTGGVRPGSFGYGHVAVADRARSQPQPAARRLRRGSSRWAAREGNLGQAARSGGADSPDGRPARGISAHGPPTLARIPLAGGPRGEFDPQSGAESPDGWPARGIPANPSDPVARIPPTGGPRGESRPAACRPWRGFP